MREGAFCGVIIEAFLWKKADRNQFGRPLKPEQIRCNGNYLAQLDLEHERYVNAGNIPNLPELVTDDKNKPSVCGLIYRYNAKKQEKQSGLTWFW